MWIVLWQSKGFDVHAAEEFVEVLNHVVVVGSDENRLDLVRLLLLLCLLHDALDLSHDELLTRQADVHREVATFVAVAEALRGGEEIFGVFDVLAGPDPVDAVAQVDADKGAFGEKFFDEAVCFAVDLFRPLEVFVEMEILLLDRKRRWRTCE